MQFNSRTYDILKYTVLIVLPAIQALWLGLGNVWNFPYVTEIGTTIALITTFLGSLLGISSKNFNKIEPIDIEGMDYLEEGEEEEDEQN